MKKILLVSLMVFVTINLRAQVSYCFSDENSNSIVSIRSYAEDEEDGFYKKTDNQTVSYLLKKAVKPYAYDKKNQKLYVETSAGNYVISLKDAYANYYKKTVPNLKGAGLDEAIASVNKRLDDSYNGINAEKQKKIDKRRKEKEEYQKKALNGDVHGVLSVDSLKSDFHHYFPFSVGDTINIIGYSFKNNLNHYALYSDKGAGLYYGGGNRNRPFNNAYRIFYEDLPSVDDPRVTSLVAQIKEKTDPINAVRRARKDSLDAAIKAREDSLNAAKIAAALKELNDSKLDLINTLKKKAPVVVKCDSWSANSVGGITVSVSVTNCSNQTIKYITFQGYFLNAVGDKCINEIGGGTVWKARGIGPIGPAPTTLDNFDERWDGYRANYTFDNPTFYSRVADTFHFSSVTIQYMNGKTISLSGKNLNSHVIYN